MAALVVEVDQGVGAGDQVLVATVLVAIARPSKVLPMEVVETGACSPRFP